MAVPLNQLLHEPPVMDLLQQPGGRPSSTWEKWFTNQRATFNQFFPILTALGSSGISQVSVHQSTSLTQDQIDALQNVGNGSIVYNTTTNKFNFYENGTWVEK